jgi:hypothetical protein
MGYSLQYPYFNSSIMNLQLKLTIMCYKNYNKFKQQQLINLMF